MQWSAQHAANAYLQALAMVKLQETDVTDHRMVEPKCMELISAMAAGRQAKHMVEITAMQGITPFTVALAVAAKHIGGQLLSCINLADDDAEHTTTGPQPWKHMLLSLRLYAKTYRSSTEPAERRRC